MWTKGEQALARPGGYLDAAALQTLQRAALSACGGGAYIAEPTTCRFDPASTRCKPGQSSACLSAAQVATAKTIYGGLAGRDGVAVPGPSPGAEADRYGWAMWMTGPSAAELDQAALYRSRPATGATSCSAIRSSTSAASTSRRRRRRRRRSPAS
jgi:hypothetical protein